MMARVLFMRVSRYTTNTENNSAMLYSIITVIELGPDTTDLWSHAVTHHLGQPIRVDYLDIIIDQADNGPLA